MQIDLRANELGRQRFGLATRQQLAAVGVGRHTIARRLSQGSWAEPLPGVIDLGTQARSWRQDLMALVLAAGPAAWASHLSAARLHGFLDVEPPRRPDVLVPRSARRRVAGHRPHTTTVLHETDVTQIGPFPVTTPARTLLDIACLLPEADLERVVWDAGRRDGALPAAIAATLHRHPRAPGRARLQRVLTELHPQIGQAGSPLEVHGLLELRRAGAPPPVLQLVVRDASGRFVARVDAAWPDARVIVEFDGAAYHSTPRQRRADERRRERLRALGWRVIVLTSGDLRPRPLAAVVAEIDARLAGRRG